MDNNLIYKKTLGAIGASVIMCSNFVIFDRLGLLLPEKEREIFCLDRQKNECLSDHLNSKFGAYLVSDSISSVISMQIV